MGSLWCISGGQRRHSEREICPEGLLEGVLLILGLRLKSCFGTAGINKATENCALSCKLPRSGKLCVHLPGAPTIHTWTHGHHSRNYFSPPTPQLFPQHASFQELGCKNEDPALSHQVPVDTNTLGASLTA